jgi:hypothetical protein
MNVRNGLWCDAALLPEARKKLGLRQTEQYVYSQVSKGSL